MFSSRIALYKYILRILSNVTLNTQLQQFDQVSSLINPRRACAERVTALICLSAAILALQATRQLMSNTNGFELCESEK